MTVDPAWIARELAKAPRSLTQEQQARLRRLLRPVRGGGMTVEPAVLSVKEARSTSTPTSSVSPRSSAALEGGVGPAT